MGGALRMRVSIPTRGLVFVVVTCKPQRINIEYRAYDLAIMAVRLQYSTGDPDYLKVIVLSETLNIPSSAFSKQDGEHYLETTKSFRL